MSEILTSREVRLKSRPSGFPSDENFSIETVELSSPGPDEVQVRNTWMSVDPYMRGRMRDAASYLPAFKIGKPLEGGAVGVVVESNYPDLQPGDTVFSMMGWREGFTALGRNLRKIDVSRIAPEAYLGVLGVTGFTAYFGILQVAKVKAGDVVFVSTAAGATGATVCQIAKLKGATVIGSAGGAEKCAYLREIGVDRTIDYKHTSDLKAALAEAAPDGIDVYFDNVGGAHLEAALASAKLFARFALCGMISGYNEEVRGPSNIALTVGKRLTLQGFLISDHFDQMPAFLQEMAPWIAGGKITWRQTVDEGIEQAPAAFAKLFSGENFGKMLVRL